MYRIFYGRKFMDPDRFKCLVSEIQKLDIDYEIQFIALPSNLTQNYFAGLKLDSGDVIIKHTWVDDQVVLSCCKNSVILLYSGGDIKYMGEIGRLSRKVPMNWIQQKGTEFILDYFKDRIPNFSILLPEPKIENVSGILEKIERITEGSEGADLIDSVRKKVASLTDGKARPTLGLYSRFHEVFEFFEKHFNGLCNIVWNEIRTLGNLDFILFHIESPSKGRGTNVQLTSSKDLINLLKNCGAKIPPLIMFGLNPRKDAYIEGPNKKSDYYFFNLVNKNLYWGGEDPGLTIGSLGDFLRCPEKWLFEPPSSDKKNMNPFTKFRQIYSFYIERMEKQGIDKKVYSGMTEKRFYETVFKYDNLSWQERKREADRLYHSAGSQKNEQKNERAIHNLELFLSASIALSSLRHLRTDSPTRKLTHILVVDNVPKNIFSKDKLDKVKELFEDYNFYFISGEGTGENAIQEGIEKLWEKLAGIDPPENRMIQKCAISCREFNYEIFNSNDKTFSIADHQIMLKDLTRDFDLILLDLHLFDSNTIINERLERSRWKFGTDGEAFLDIMMDKIPHVPVFIFTGSRDPNVVQRTYNAGADFFLDKQRAYSLVPHVDHMTEERGSLIKMISEPSWTKNFIGKLRRWSHNKELLWFGDKCYAMVNHGFIHANGVWKLVNDFFASENSPALNFPFEYIYALSLAVWLHDIGHHGSEKYGQIDEIRDVHGLLSGEFLLRHPAFFGLTKKDRLTGLLDMESLRENLIKAYQDGDRESYVKYVCALLCIFHKSNSPLTDPIVGMSVEERRKIPEEFWSEKQEQYITLQDFAEKLKDKDKMYLLRSAALLRLIDALDIGEKRVGCRSDKEFKLKVVCQERDFWKQELSEFEKNPSNRCSISESMRIESIKRHVGFLAKQIQYYDLHSAVIETLISFRKDNTKTYLDVIFHTSHDKSQLEEEKKDLTGKNVADELIHMVNKEIQAGQPILKNWFEDELNLEPGYILIGKKDDSAYTGVDNFYFKEKIAWRLSPVE